MSVEEYTLKFILFSKYVQFFVYNPMDDMSWFFTDFSDIVNEECRTSMFH